MTSPSERTAGPAAGGGMEMFLVRPADGHGDDALESIGEHAAALGGVVLMSTGGGSLVVGLPPGRKDGLQAHSLVGFVGGVSFAEDAPGLKLLRQRFAINAARQLAEQGRVSINDPFGRAAPDRPPAPTWSQRLADPRTFLSSNGRAIPPHSEGSMS
jgi:hypothetical protein